MWRRFAARRHGPVTGDNEGELLDAYDLKTETIIVGETEFRICSLLDTNQAPESYEKSRASGIPDAYWALFGVLWEAGIVLAGHMDRMDVDDKHTLEIGCGLALPGLVAARHGFDVTVSDVHPLTERFLKRNVALNHLDAMDYLTIDWTESNPGLQRFQRVIASDVCYLPQHPQDLAEFADRIGTPDVEVVVTDPGRTPSRRMRKAFREAGWDAEIYDPQEGDSMGVTVYRRG